MSEESEALRAADEAWMREAIAQARRAWLVSDLSKLGRNAPARIASMAALDTVITDRALPEALRGKCAQWQTRLLVAEA